MESAVGHGNFSAIDVHDLSLPPIGNMPPHAPPRPAAELETGSEALRISPALAPSTFAAGIMPTAITAAILQLPQGSPPHAPPRPAAELEAGSSTEALQISPAAAPSPVAVNIMATATSAILQLPQGTPSVLFLTFFVSNVCAVLVSVVAQVLDRISRQPSFPQQQSRFNLPGCIMFLENMVFYFLFAALLSSGFIFVFVKANWAGTQPVDFFPALSLLFVLLLSLCYAFRLAVYSPPAGSGEQQHRE